MKTFEPIRQALMIEADQQRTFDMFVRQLSAWWPMRPPGVQRRTSDVRVEEWPDGRIYRVDRSGTEADLGRVISCDVPRSFSFSWGPASGPERAEVYLRFQSLGPALTRVVVEHRDWECLSTALFEGYTDFAGGWVSALRRFAALFEVEPSVAGSATDDVLAENRSNHRG